MSKARTVIALRAGAGLFVVLVGCGALLGGVSASGAPTPAMTATGVLSSETPVPPPAPSGPTAGGALPVVPVGGGACIIGLNCGCIPHHTCPTPHARPAPTNDHPHVAPGGPAGGGG
jgi:hypothetical protein